MAVRSGFVRVPLCIRAILLEKEVNFRSKPDLARVHRKPSSWFCPRSFPSNFGCHVVYVSSVEDCPKNRFLQDGPRQVTPNVIHSYYSRHSSERETEIDRERERASQPFLGILIFFSSLFSLLFRQSWHLRPRNRPALKHPNQHLNKKNKKNKIKAAGARAQPRSG